MYRQSHAALALGAFGGLGFNLGGAGVVWSLVFAATGVGMCLSAGRIALELGFPHPGELLRSLRGNAVDPVALCPHCKTAHA